MTSTPYSPDRWRHERLNRLQSITPLLPGAPDKRPTVGNSWQQHPGVHVAELFRLAPDCICWHVGASPHHIAIDIDGPAAAAFCQSHGCDPYTADTWQIVRTENTERLKLVFTVTADQKATLAAGAKTVKFDGQELAVFARPGTQIVVLGQHFTKESKFTENDDQYAWAGRLPAEAQPLPPKWFNLLSGVFCGDRPLKPKTERTITATPQRPAPATAPRKAFSSSADWRNSSLRNPCPVCGRDHSGACSIHIDGNSVWCCHGETKSAPDCSASGQTIAGRDGRTWAYVRTEEHDSFGDRSLFVIDTPLPTPEPPLDSAAFIPADAPTQPDQQSFTAEADEDDERERKEDLDSFRKRVKETDVDLNQLFPPGLAALIESYAATLNMPPKAFVLPILCTSASIIGKRIWISPEPDHGWKEPAILWGINLTPSGAGKSPISNATISAPLIPWEIKEQDKHKSQLQAWKAGRAKAEQTAKAKSSEIGGSDDDPVAEFLSENPQPSLRRLVVNDVTFEKLEMILADGADPGLLAAHDELTKWFSQLCRTPNSTDRSKWLSLFGAENIKTERIGRDPVFVVRPAVSLFGNLQPAIMQTLWEEDSKQSGGHPDADGLWSRFLIQILPDWKFRYRKQDVKLPSALQSLYEKIDAGIPDQLSDDPLSFHLVTLTEPSLELFVNFSDALEEEKDRRRTDEDRQFLSKGRGVALRLAMVLHAIHQASCGLSLLSEVKLETMQAAITLYLSFLTQRDQLMATLQPPRQKAPSNDYLPMVRNGAGSMETSRCR